MDVLFLTMSCITNVEQRDIYPDLMKHFRDKGHNVYIMTPRERRLGVKSNIVYENGVHIIGVRTLNIQKCSIIEKGLGQILIESQFKRAIKKLIPEKEFHLILYSTPPITFPNVIKYLKKKSPAAKTYLLLKDIFPQNAVDIGMLNPEGFKIKGSGFIIDWAKYFMYRYFKKKEKVLYKISDYIGCMSPANVKYLLAHNPEVEANCVEVAPNSLELQDDRFVSSESLDIQREDECFYIRKKYDLPTNRPIFIYGGNLGKPQGIDYLIRCLEAVKNRLDCYFIVVGSGTEKRILDNWYERHVHDDNLAVKVMSYLPKEDYDMLVKYCDVGLIFLDHRFTIPNYPSRLLSYLEYKMPVICATDVNTDIGKIAEENGYGYWCESVKPENFTALVDKMLASDMKTMGERGYEFLKKNYLVENTYNAIMSHF